MIGPTGREAVTVNQACNIKDVAPWTIYKWMRQGKLESFQVAGGGRRIYKDSLEAIVKGERKRWKIPKPKRTAPKNFINF